MVNPFKWLRRVGMWGAPHATLHGSELHTVIEVLSDSTEELAGQVAFYARREGFLNREESRYRASIAMRLQRERAILRRLKAALGEDTS